jgi:hypothetical protein
MLTAIGRDHGVILAIMLKRFGTQHMKGLRYATEAADFSGSVLPKARLFANLIANVRNKNVIKP